jgi:hypothetical protein
MRNTILAIIAFLGIAAFLPSHAMAQEKSIVIASTTSTQDSGLYGHLLPIFTQMTGIAVKVLAQGTLQALDTGRRGDADVVFVHAKFAELRFLAEGHGVKRFPVMYNDFVLVGPKSDPASIKGMHDVSEALRTIREKQATFISRGDHSGTHLAELALWNKDVGIDIERDNGAWYESIGRGMGATLYMAAARGGANPEIFQKHSNSILAERTRAWMRWTAGSDFALRIRVRRELFHHALASSDHKILSQRGRIRGVVPPRNNRGQPHAVPVLDADDCDVRPVAGRRSGYAGAVSPAAVKRKPRPVGRGFAFSAAEHHSQYLHGGKSRL